MPRWVLIAILVALTALAVVYIAVPAYRANAPTTPSATSTPSGADNPSLEDLIVVTSLKEGDKITSPLTIRGQARGRWYFEASFPVYVVDWDGKIIAQAPAQAQGEWMTEEYVPFEVTLTFEDPSWEADFSKRGAVILHNDNPSGLPQNDKALEIPVVF